MDCYFEAFDYMVFPNFMLSNPVMLVCLADLRAIATPMHPFYYEVTPLITKRTHMRHICILIDAQAWVGSSLRKACVHKCVPRLCLALD